MRGSTLANSGGQWVNWVCNTPIPATREPYKTWRDLIARECPHLISYSTYGKSFRGPVENCVRTCAPVVCDVNLDRRHSAYLLAYHRDRIIHIMAMLLDLSNELLLKIITYLAPTSTYSYYNTPTHLLGPLSSSCKRLNACCGYWMFKKYRLRFRSTYSSHKHYLTPLDNARLVTSRWYSPDVWRQSFTIGSYKDWKNSVENMTRRIFSASAQLLNGT